MQAASPLQHCCSQVCIQLHDIAMGEDSLAHVLLHKPGEHTCWTYNHVCLVQHMLTDRRLHAAYYRPAAARGLPCVQGPRSPGWCCAPSLVPKLQVPAGCLLAAKTDSTTSEGGDGASPFGTRLVRVSGWTGLLLLFRQPVCTSIAFALGLTWSPQLLLPILTRLSAWLCCSMDPSAPEASAVILWLLQLSSCRLLLHCKAVASASTSESFKRRNLRMVSDCNLASLSASRLTRSSIPAGDPRPHAMLDACYLSQWCCTNSATNNTTCPCNALLP